MSVGETADGRRESDARNVFVVIPVYNRIALTTQCLDSLSQQSYGSLTVVVVDDGSTDSTRDVLAEQYPSVVVLDGTGALWWTGATNLGVSWVLDRCNDDDFVLTLNNDTVVSPAYVEELVRTASSEAPSLIGSVAVDARDGDTIEDGGPTVHWSTGKWARLNRGRSLRCCLGEGIAYTAPDVLPGRGTLVPVACFRSIGLYDAKRLPHYAADYEFSRRALDAGYELLMSYRAPVLSHVQATGLSTREYRLPWRQFVTMFFTRRSPSCLIYRWRFAVLAAPPRIMLLFLVLDTVRTVGGALRGQVTGKLPRLP